ncbi:ABC transporter permease [Amycolatopsis granulosa]|uniref:ABC transporter permease n=1 Tax=Amycolatopsis granulosa TaxID=185684 RepID=UPI00141F9DD2|nr:ABC transporter permease [Amycolatopsis granulosa]NIH85254.1 ribose/xylose/arabinose/galactoside ABC-type transport system permease subunit [Amycolatopsis granulosa]
MTIPKKIDSDLAVRLGVAVIVFAYFAITFPVFSSTGNMFTVMEGFAFLGLIALGVGLTVMAGELDMSIASVAALGGVIAVKQAGHGIYVAVLSALAVGLVLGVAQGIAIFWLKINSLVFTIGTLVAFRGVAYLLSDSKTIIVPDLDIADLVSKKLYIFSPFSILTIVVLVLTGLFLSYTRWGKEIGAVGGGRVEALAAGIPLWRPLLIAFGMSGAMGALVGAMLSLKSGSASPTEFADLLLPGVTAALIGGVSLRGGRGTVLGIAAGTLTLRFIVSGLSIEGSAVYVANFAIGVLVLVVLAVELIKDSAATKRWFARTFKRTSTSPLSRAG